MNELYEEYELNKKNGIGKVVAVRNLYDRYDSNKCIPAGAQLISWHFDPVRRLFHYTDGSITIANRMGYFQRGTKEIK